MSHARCVAAVGAIALTGCLPYPVQSPRVEPGISLSAVLGVRVLDSDPDSLTETQSRGGTSLFPEAAFGASVGVGRSDGKGGALRVGGVMGFPGPWGADAYAQLPRVGPIVGGAGALVAPELASNNRKLSVALPYVALGWQLSDESMLYGSMTIIHSHQTHSQYQPNAPDTTRSGQAIVIGFQNRRALELRDGSASRRIFLAVFRGDRDVGSTRGPFGGPQISSLAMIGASFDATWPWKWFNEPTSPRRRRRPP
jgi:hypothetical protein